MLDDIDIPSRGQLDRLMAIEGEPVVSIYFANDPLADAAAVRASLERVIREAVATVTQTSGPDSAETIEAELMESVLDDDWSLRARTLALFATPTLSMEFRLANELPTRTYVEERARVAPLLRSVSLPQSAFVLAIAHGSVRLLELGPETAAGEIGVPGLPRDAASAAGKASIADRSPKGRIQGSEGTKLRLRQYARTVDRTIAPVLAGSGAPLIIAGTEPIVSIFRSVCSYGDLCDETISGSPERLTDAELESSARAVLDNLNLRRVRAVADLLSERRGSDRTTEDAAVAAIAAERGAVETLTFDLELALNDHPSAAAVGAEELESLLRSAWSTGAQIMALRSNEMPGGASVAASLRYPVR